MVKSKNPGKLAASPLSEVPAVANYVVRIGAEFTSVRIARVSEFHGRYPRQLAKIEFNPDGSVSASEEYEPTELEAANIAAAILAANLPTSCDIAPHSSPPNEVSAALKSDPSSVFKFMARDERIKMYQIRFENDDGTKTFKTFTYWTDGCWRQTEPDGLLPLWGLEQLKEFTTVMIHEGAKAARACRDMVAGSTPADSDKLAAHPWGKELSVAAHVGWIGGALSPSRTDWSAIDKSGARYVVIIADNDELGRAAVPQIARQLNTCTKWIQFTDEFPSTFDLGDEFPKKMFKVFDEKLNYVGPTYFHLLNPATYATKKFIKPDGKSAFGLRKGFKGEWFYIEEMDKFVHRDFPDLYRSERILNNLLAPFSDVRRPSDLILKNLSQRTEIIVYRPDKTDRWLTVDGKSALNLHRGSGITSEPGNISLFHEYLLALIPDKTDRTQTERWISTLLAKPEVRMSYAILLFSKTQGVGKSTLAEAILAPLVGARNVSRPNEAALVGNFNSWAARCRLAIVDEIYQGSNWKTMNQLKSVITEPHLEINEKHEKPYVLENWIHIFATSNSPRALKLEGTDRRWFLPTINEQGWESKKFRKLREWLESGNGLSHILHWAENYSDYVNPGEHAPKSAAKAQMIVESYSEPVRMAIELAEKMAENSEPMALCDFDIMEILRGNIREKIWETPSEILDCMRSAGLNCSDRVSIAGSKRRLVFNEPAEVAISKKTDTREQLRDIRTKTLNNVADI